jgi:hypothetical protein
MDPAEADELEAMFAAAEVKEDYLDLGMPVAVEGRGATLPGSPPREETLKARRMIGTVSNSKKYKVKSVDAESNMCLNYIRSGATLCLRLNCSVNHGGGSGEGDQMFEPPGEGVLVILKNNQVAFAAPTLPTSAVERDVVEEWEGQSFPFED